MSQLYTPPQSHPQTHASHSPAQKQLFTHKMQSSWDWTNVPSLADTRNADSGSRTDAFSLINAITELNYLNINATEDMALSLAKDPSSSDNVSPVRSAVVDWVQDQSQHDQQSKNSTGLQQGCGNGTPPHASQPKQAPTNTNGHIPLEERCQPVKKVYDIETLLRLKEAQSAVPVMLRVKPEAIAGKCYRIADSQAAMRWPDILSQRTSSSIWELQRHAGRQRVLEAFRMSQTSLLDSQRDQST